MSTFIGQLVGFAVIVWLLVRFVVPPVRRLMASQQESIRKQIEEAAAAAARKADASQAHAKAVTDAKTEATRVTEEAHADAERIAEQLRAQADVEAERVRATGGQQVQLLRSQAVRQLRGSLGTESVERAAALIRDHVSDSGRQSATVDRFLDELDAMAPSPAQVEHPVLARMRSASRQGLQDVLRRLDDVIAGRDAGSLTALGDDLTRVAGVLTRETAVTRLLGAPVDDTAAKVRLVERLFDGKIDAGALELVKAVAGTRWSAEADLVTAIEHLSRQALLIGAERAGDVDDVEDQLFRFSRVLDAQPQLDTLLSATGTPVEGRVALMRRVLQGSGANAVTTALLANSVGLLRGRRAGEAIADLAQIAVARRGEVVARVGAAADLSEAQRKRLGEVLTRIYSHPVRVQLHIDPELLGGLAISVGDEIIDGSLSSRLAAARAQLPD